eukprot:4882636-Ditylum_brightwellii.AAC.1
MTDTCITGQLFKTKFVKTIQQIVKEKGMIEDDIKDLKNDLDDFHFKLQAQTEVGQIYRAVEKEFANTAQYV